MDYPQLNFLFGLGLLFTLVVNISLRILLSKVELSPWLLYLSWAALILNLLTALYIESLFLRYTTPAFNLQLGLGFLLMASLGALITASLYRRTDSARLAGVLFGAQMLVSLVSLLIAFGLYRSLVPLPV
jgi:hypothetical protein